jgi:hypothetical protein
MLCRSVTTTDSQSRLAAVRTTRFLVETRLHQWNQIRILPSLPIEEGMKDVQEATPLF